MDDIIKQRVQAYYVVAGNDATGPFSLDHAKSILHKYTAGATAPSRAIFQVQGCTVLKDPHTVGGEKQGDGQPAGFNKYWHDWNDINRMHAILHHHHQRFYVAIANDAKGPFCLSHAKNILRKYPRGETPPSRAIFEVENGAFVKDPHHVGGEYQGRALKAGFNRYWNGWGYIHRMHDIVQKRVEAYYVVTGNDVHGPFSLTRAKGIL